MPGLGYVPLEVGPLARQMMADRPDAADFQDSDPFIKNIIDEAGPSVLTRVLARMHEAPKYFKNVQKWLKELDLHGEFYVKPAEPHSGKGFGSTEAARGALSDWIVLEDGKIANYQVITPTAWNIGPRDGSENLGPMEKAFIGTPVENPDFPVELATSRTVSTPAWCAPCTPTTASPAGNWRSSAWAAADRQPDGATGPRCASTGVRHSWPRVGAMLTPRPPTRDRGVRQPDARGRRGRTRARAAARRP